MVNVNVTAGYLGRPMTQTDGLVQISTALRHCSAFMVELLHWLCYNSSTVSTINIIMSITVIITQALKRNKFYQFISFSIVSLSNYHHYWNCHGTL